MSRYLVTPNGPIDITDADTDLVDIITSLATKLADEKARRCQSARDARKHLRHLTTARDDLDTLREEVASSDVGDLKKQLRAETKRADRLAKKVDQLTAERRELTTERKNLTDRVRDLNRSNDKYRQRLEAMKVDLDRAQRGAQPRATGAAMSDLQIATVMLADLNDRLIAQARQATSVAVATGLRLAAREVSRARQRLTERTELAVAS